MTAADPQTLVVTLDSPYTFLLDELTLLAPVPEEAVDTPEKAAAFADQPIGNGMYMMTEPWRHDEGITVERSPDYYGTPGLADSIEFEMYADDTAPYLELGAGNLDIATPPLTQIAQARQEYGDRFIETPAAFVYSVGFPVQMAPFDNEDLRRSVSLAIDLEAVTERLLEGASLPADRFVPDTFPGASPEACEYSGYDLSAGRHARRVAQWQGTAGAPDARPDGVPGARIVARPSSTGCGSGIRMVDRSDWADRP